MAAMVGMVGIAAKVTVEMEAMVEVVQRVVVKVAQVVMVVLVMAILDTMVISRNLENLKVAADKISKNDKH
jgi:hypothetical protein